MHYWKRQLPTINADGYPRRKEVHLSRLRLADLALDTRIVSGAATTNDALWAGGSVLTLLRFTDVGQHLTGCRADRDDHTLPGGL